MKHYHGTPIGGRRTDADQFCEGRCLLIPWRRPEDLERALQYGRSVIVDNSAFTFWRTGEKPDWGKYIKWVKSFAHHPRFEFALIPDVIDGSEKDNNDLIAMWDKKCWHPVKVEGCPVWHMHESIDRLRYLCNSRWRYVAIGSSGDWPTPGVGKWWGRMDEAFDAICVDGFPTAHMHGLRMLRPEIVERYPFSSCDSTNAVQNGRRESLKNGVDSLWGAMTIARRMERAQSPCRFIRGPVQTELALSS